MFRVGDGLSVVNYCLSAFQRCLKWLYGYYVYRDPSIIYLGFCFELRFCLYVLIAADFGGLETLKGYYHAHPILKSIQGKKLGDIFTFVDVPRRRRSMGRGRVRVVKKPAVQDDGTLHDLVVYMLAFWIFIRGCKL